MEKILKSQAHIQAHVQTTSSHAAAYICVPTVHVLSYISFSEIT